MRASNVAAARVGGWRIIGKDCVSGRHFGQLTFSPALACQRYARHAPAACPVREDEAGRNRPVNLQSSEEAVLCGLAADVPELAVRGS